jgi:hypothetical protein
MGRRWEGGGQFESNLGPRLTGLHHAKGGFPSKVRGIEGEVNRELARGVKKGNCAITCIVNLYMCK